MDEVNKGDLKNYLPGYKLLHDTLKHITTLSTGSLVVASAFMSNISLREQNIEVIKSLFLYSSICLGLSISISVIIMFYLTLVTHYSAVNNEEALNKLSTAASKYVEFDEYHGPYIGSVVNMGVILAVVLFLGGLLFLVLTASATLQ